MVYVGGSPVGDREVFVGDSDELADVRWVSLDEADAAFAPFGGMSLRSTTTCVASWDDASLILFETVRPVRAVAPI